MLDEDLYMIVGVDSDQQSRRQDSYEETTYINLITA